MSEKTRYTDEELEEFRQIILEKLALAKRDYDQMMDSLTNRDSNDVDDTSPTYKALEEGSETQSNEVCCTSAEVHSGTESCIGAHRQQDLRH